MSKHRRFILFAGRYLAFEGYGVARMPGREESTGKAGKVGFRFSPLLALAGGEGGGEGESILRKT
jgi:hypothetical protein